MKKYKGVVCHVSVLHYRKDLRIFVREAASLARAGYEVHLIVADGLGDETAEHGIRIHDVGQRRTTLRRLTLDHYAVYQKALSIDAALYHFHDPELLLLGWLLKRKGKRVISDVHEDYPLTLRAQKENSYGWRRLSGWIMDRAERTLFPRHDAVITTSPVLLQRLKQYLRVPLLNIGGFPDIREEFLENPAASKSFDLVYVGSISLTRGIVETIAVLEKGPYRYLLLGDYRNQRTSDTIQALPAYATQVNYRPFTSSRQTIQTAIYEAKIGMANLQNVANFRVAYLIKIFEYMAAGLPVIATNFPLWQTIIEQHECGLTIPPDDPSALVAAIDHLLDNPEQATQMGQNGRRAVEKHYNWEQEEQKLLALYTQLLAE